MMTKILATALLAATMMSGANAGTVFQSIPDLTVAPSSNAWCSSCGGTYRAFDAFTLAGTTNIASVTFAVQSNYNFPTDIDVSFWTDNAGSAGTQISSAVFAPAAFTSTFNTAFNTTLVTVDYAQVLSSGTYWISFYNSTNLGVPGYAGGSNLMYQTIAGRKFESAGFALSSAAVPDAPTWALLIGGFGLVGMTARRRRSAVA